MSKQDLIGTSCTVCTTTFKLKTFSNPWIDMLGFFSEMLRKLHFDFRRLAKNSMTDDCVHFTHMATMRIFFLDAF